jgi:ATP-dependent DNA helicase RecG
MDFFNKLLCGNKTNEKTVESIKSYFSSGNISKLLFFFPFRYIFYKKGLIDEEFGNFTPIIYGKVLNIKEKNNMKIFTIADNNHIIKKRFFIYFKHKMSINLEVNENYYFIGEIKNNNGYYLMFFPKYQSKEPLLLVEAVYHKIPNVNIFKIQELLKATLKDLNPIYIFKNNINYESTVINHSHTLNYILENIHNINYNNNIDHILNSIKLMKIFEYLCFLQGISQITSEEGETKTLKYKFHLPITLTNCQKIAIKNISLNLESHKATVNFLQGDVGSGKTLVAFITLNKVLINGFNGCFMAPTTILAQQHYENYKKLFPEFNTIKVESGYKNKKYLKEIEDVLINKIPTLFFGTHSLLYEKLDYISFIVIDEQHKFGMEQRKVLINKFPKSDVLFLSATPIPRTLFMLQINQMFLHILKESPFKKNIKTIIVNNKNLILDKIIELSKKEKILWINGAIDNYEKHFHIKTGVNTTYNFFKEKNLEVYLLHGRMSDEDKLSTIKNFQKGILISTICVETGIDIYDLNYIVIEEASNFGLATLHQLRGRIGRQGQLSECILIEEKYMERLQILLSSNDGFEIAEIDLQQRGAGNFFSKEQCGFYNFKSGNFNNKLFNLAVKIFKNKYFYEDNINYIKDFLFKTLDVHY